MSEPTYPKTSAAYRPDLPWSSAIRDGTHFDAGTCRWLAKRKSFTYAGQTYHLVPIRHRARGQQSRLWRVPEVEKALAKAHKAREASYVTLAQPRTPGEPR